MVDFCLMVVVFVVVVLVGVLVLVLVIVFLLLFIDLFLGMVDFVKGDGVIFDFFVVNFWLRGLFFFL